MELRTLPREFYLRDAASVARGLLGCRLVRETKRGLLIAEIVETEAYLGVTDRACHSWGDRRTPRTEVLYGEGGHAYVYFIYGMHCMLNAVTGTANDPCAVLIRGARPLEGQDQIAQNRFGCGWDELTASRRRALMDGPGKLCAALEITMEDNRTDLCAGALRICEGTAVPEEQVRTGPRIGIDYAGEAAAWPLRFQKINS